MGRALKDQCLHVPPSFLKDSTAMIQSPKASSTASPQMAPGSDKNPPIKARFIKRPPRQKDRPAHPLWDGQVRGTTHIAESQSLAPAASNPMTPGKRRRSSRWARKPCGSWGSGLPFCPERLAPTAVSLFGSQKASSPRAFETVPIIAARQPSVNLFIDKGKPPAVYWTHGF